VIRKHAALLVLQDSRSQSRISKLVHLESFLSGLFQVVRETGAKVLFVAPILLSLFLSVSCMPALLIFFFPEPV